MDRRAMIPGPTIQELVARENAEREILGGAPLVLAIGEARASSRLDGDTYTVGDLDDASAMDFLDP